MHRRILGINNYLFESVRSIDELQIKLRRVEFLWLFGVFAGLGFILSSEDAYLPFSRLLGVSLVSLLGLIVVMIFYIQNILRYQKIIDIIFVEGLKLEKQFAWLTQYRAHLVKSYENKSAIWAICWFYNLSGSIYLLIAGASFAFYMDKIDHSLSIVVSIFTVFFIYLFVKILKVKSKKLTEHLNYTDVKFEVLNIENVDQDTFNTNWSAYLSLNSLYNYYHQASNIIKQYAITWVLAVFFGIGYLLSAKLVNFPFPYLVAIILIAITGIAGLTLMWGLDLLNYQKFMNSLCQESLNFENKFDWLPKEKSIMELHYPKKTLIKHFFLFYVLCAFILYVVIAVSMMCLLKNSGFYLSASFLFGSIVVFFIYLRYVYCQCHKHLV